jgi:hypothetical protein
MQDGDLAISPDIALTHGKAYQKSDNNGTVNGANTKKSPISGDFSCVTMWIVGWITWCITPFHDPVAQQRDIY